MKKEKEPTKQALKIALENCEAANKNLSAKAEFVDQLEAGNKELLKLNAELQSERAELKKEIEKISNVNRMFRGEIIKKEKTQKEFHKILRSLAKVAALDEIDAETFELQERLRNEAERKYAEEHKNDHWNDSANHPGY